MTDKQIEYRKYLQSQKWQEKRKKVFERALKNANSTNRFGVCEKCGYQPWRPILQVHHLTYERVFHEEIEDLILLCPKCHKKHHKGGNE